MTAKDTLQEWQHYSILGKLLKDLFPKTLIKALQNVKITAKRKKTGSKKKTH